MEQANKPIAIDLPGKGRNYIFYEESLVITQLRYFPYVQLIILGLFLIVVAVRFPAGVIGTFGSLVRRPRRNRGADPPEGSSASSAAAKVAG